MFADQGALFVPDSPQLAPTQLIQRQLFPAEAVRKNEQALLCAADVQVDTMGLNEEEEGERWGVYLRPTRTSSPLQRHSAEVLPRYQAYSSPA